jgi:adenosylmethionine-8-amino-7-oxononanoate aminotransferase
MKMAIQYWHAKEQANKQLFLTIRNGYHGDTFAAMSVSDPVTGMHSIFQDTLSKQFFVNSPDCPFGQPCSDEDIAEFEQTLDTEKDHIAAVIMEPIVQGAGGMRFYSAEYLHRVRELCNQHHVLLILDEIATGFGRTGKLFACEYADVTPDIMCIGKALTGGYMSLAATLTSKDVSDTISQGDPGVFMHGPTFMANPLACTAALASLKLLLASPWQSEISRIEEQLKTGLEPCRGMAAVQDVRVLGAIGVVELNNPVDMKLVQPLFVDAGVWIRPFGKLVYLMPPFIIENEDLEKLTTAVSKVVSSLSS